MTSFKKCYVVYEKTNLAHARNIRLASMIVTGGCAQVFYCVLSVDHVQRGLLYVAWSAASAGVPQALLEERNRQCMYLNEHENCDESLHANLFLVSCLNDAA